MSKNFELMQNLGKEHEMFQTATATYAFACRAFADPSPAGRGKAAGRCEAARTEDGSGAAGRAYQTGAARFLCAGRSGSRLVVVSGMESGNGCSWICARMAEMLASQSPGSVCVVDANLRSPGLHREFGVTNHYGLTDALQVSDPIRGFVTSTVAAESVAAELRGGE